MTNAHANKGFASRLGYALGTLVRFCLDHRFGLSCAGSSELASLVVLFVIFAQNFTWMASAFMTLLSFGLIGWALVIKVGFPSSSSWKKTKPKQLRMDEDVFRLRAQILGKSILSFLILIVSKVEGRLLWLPSIIWVLVF
ncbi:hypothetical protein [Pseudomonas aeruginosa]|uniref:hypothetical protein n=1 Tax=Pseudomonas aeruginosa TaxID=287 RepID=UPI0037A0C71F